MTLAGEAGLIRGKLAIRRYNVVEFSNLTPDQLDQLSRWLIGDVAQLGFDTGIRNPHREREELRQRMADFYCVPGRAYYVDEHGNINYTKPEKANWLHEGF